MIDSHIHSDSRSDEDFNKMVNSGIDTAITCAYYPTNISKPDVLLNHFHRLQTTEIERCQKNGLKLYVAIGVHPRNIISNQNYILDQIPTLLKDKNTIAIGEIGLEKASSEEQDIFKKQVQMADEIGTNIIVHTPRKNKKKISKITKKILDENINPKQVIIEHITNEIISDFIDTQYHLGLTVQPEKLSPSDAVEIIKKYGSNRILLNSDSSFSPSDILAVAKTEHQLKLANIKEKDIINVTTENAKKFYKI